MYNEEFTIQYQDDDGYTVEDWHHDGTFGGKQVAIVRHYNEPVTYLNQRGTGCILRGFGPRDESKDLVCDSVEDAIAQLKEPKL